MRIPLIVLAKAREPEKFMLFPNEMEENQSINLMCSADVGSPQGTIKIWKMSQNKDTPELIYASNGTSDKTENCTEFLNGNVTYYVTRDDNGDLFRCSSQNYFTQGPGPSRDSSKISVICIYTIFHASIIFHGFRYYLQYHYKTSQLIYYRVLSVK